MILNRFIKQQFAALTQKLKTVWTLALTHLSQVMTGPLTQTQSKGPMMYVRNAASCPTTVNAKLRIGEAATIPAGMIKEKINAANVALAIDVFMTALTQRHAEDFSDAELADIRTKLQPFLTSAGDSYIYYKHNSPVGMLGLARNYLNPILQKKVNHVGAMGYVREQVTQAEARWLTNDWHDVIKSNELECPMTTARIHGFNYESRRLCVKWGFVPIESELMKESVSYLA